LLIAKAAVNNRQAVIYFREGASFEIASFFGPEALKACRFVSGIERSRWRGI
jgi:hypothetical protein